MRTLRSLSLPYKLISYATNSNNSVFFLAFSASLCYIVYMIKKLEKLHKDLAWWQDKLNRSRKESTRSIRAVHVQHLQDEIEKLTQQIRERDLKMLNLI